MSIEDVNRVQKIVDESVVMGELSLIQVMHPEYGELVLIQQNGNNISSPDQIKIIEMAKIFIGAEILSHYGELEGHTE